MLTVDLKKIVEAEVIPWERGTYGVAYTIKRGGFEYGEGVGTKSEAEAIVRRVAMNLDTSLDGLRLSSRDPATR